MNDLLKSVITCDLDGKVETFSEGAQKLFGYTLDEIIGKGRVSDFSPGQVVLGHVVNWLKESVEKGVWEGDTVFLHKDGHEMPCHVKITPTKGKNGEHIGYCGITTPLDGHYAFAVSHGNYCANSGWCSRSKIGWVPPELGLARINRSRRLSATYCYKHGQ